MELDSRLAVAGRGRSSLVCGRHGAHLSKLLSRCRRREPLSVCNYAQAGYYDAAGC